MTQIMVIKNKTTNKVQNWNQIKMAPNQINSQERLCLTMEKSIEIASDSFDLFMNNRNGWTSIRLEFPQTG